MPSTSTTPITPVSPTVRRGSRGEAVIELQHLLNTRIAAGLDVDGDFGPLTERMVIDFQTFYFLVPDGIVGPKTWVVLHSGKVVGLPVLTMNHRGELVMRVQRMLKDLEHYSGEADGIFGPKTRQAVEQFQTRHSLTVTGKMDEATWNSLSSIYIGFVLS